MKKLVGIDKDLGGGDVKGSAGAHLGIEGSNLVLDLSVKASYPLEKVLTPANKAIDDAIDAVEKAVPGDWDKAILEPIRIAAKAQLLKAISE